MKLNKSTRLLLLFTAVAGIGCLALAWVGVLSRSWRIMVFYVAAETLMWLVTILAARRRFSALLRGDLSAILANVSDVTYVKDAAKKDGGSTGPWICSCRRDHSEGGGILKISTDCPIHTEASASLFDDAQKKRAEP